MKLNRYGDFINQFITNNSNIDENLQIFSANLISGDGCSSICSVETGFSCTGEPSICQKCGNGQVEGSEVIYC